MNDLRFPAEWEPQSAVLIAWPHADTDWAERLAEVETTYIALVSAITRFQKALVLVMGENLHKHAQQQLSNAGVNLDRVQFVRMPYNDTWLRDSGPISLRRKDGFHLLDFHFTAWGGKFNADLDDLIVSQLIDKKTFNSATYERVEFALEGGGIETDGEGTLLTTWHCLHERHTDLSRTEIEAILSRHLRQHRTLWLDHGYLEGDDTDAHIDTLARFASRDSIVYQACDDRDDSHYSELKKMADELAELRQADGQAYRLFALPWAQPIFDGERRLAASYANFLIINGAVLMPSYGDEKDQAAVNVLQQAFPDREIIAVPCKPLIWQNGSLHCITMQLPEGLLS
jgi:agmatine/peptidylarginine deiminase